ncbi:MAG: YceI family protein [Flavobacteriaceae bacterium]
MKKTIATLLLTTAAFFSSQNLIAQETTINAEESSIHWLGKKVTGQHEGNISLKSGTINMTDGAVTGGNFVVDMASMSCTDLSGEYAGKLIGHLKSDDFFDVETHPEASLTFTNVEAKGDGVYAVTGDFTIKGKTNPAQFDLTVAGGTASAKVIIDRALYDIRYGSNSFFDNLGDKAIYNDFELDVTLKL